eukprot:6374014-Prymnesium_polylepis.1
MVAGPASAAAVAIAACATPFGTCAPLASGGPSVGLLPHSDASGSDTSGSSCAFSQRCGTDGRGAMADGAV